MRIPQSTPVQPVSNSWTDGVHGQAAHVLNVALTALRPNFYVGSVRGRIICLRNSYRAEFCIARDA